MKKNSIITVFRVFAALVVWFVIYKLYGAFMDPMLEGKLSESIRMLIGRMVIPYTVGIGAAYLILRGMRIPEEYKNDPDSPDYTKVTPGLILKAFLVQMGISMPVMMVFNIIYRILGLPLPGMTADEIFGKHLFFYLILLLVFNPVMEEILFRRLLLDRLLVLGETTAIIISAVFFGLPHVFSQGLPQMFATFAIGLVWAYVRINTGKLWPCIILHALFNLYGCYFALFMSQNMVTAILMFLINMFLLPVIAAIIIIIRFGNKKAEEKSHES